ncbi:uncharacterized protein GJ701_015971 isoform 2-T2 [Geothlypis trichas]
MIYSSGRESFFNLNSTWYDPSGSWLDTRRTPFRYAYSTCCSSGGSSSGCHGEGAQGMCGHDYRHYGYRQPRCAERCRGSSGSCHGAGDSCVRRPTYSYGGSGGCQGYGRSVCAERCQGSSGSCHGGGSSCVRRPTYSYGGSGGCQGYGRSVCSERCHGTVAQGGKPCCGTPVQSIPVQSCPQPVQSIPVQNCPQPVQVCPCPCPQPVQVCPRPCPPPVKSIPVQTCPPPMQVCPRPCPPPVKSIPVQTCPPPVKSIPVKSCPPSSPDLSLSLSPSSPAGLCPHGQADAGLQNASPEDQIKDVRSEGEQRELSLSPLPLVLLCHPSLLCPPARNALSSCDPLML